jgi:TRAP-type C4-dicarboxylate transport system permease small subunit
MRRFYDQLGTIEAMVARVFLVIMVLLVFSAAVARLAGSPLNWALDIATALFAWACLIAGDVAWRHDRLMCVDILTTRLSERGRIVFRLINHAIIVAFLLYVVPTGVWLSWVSRARSFQGIPEISYSWVTMSMPIGGLLLLATAAIKIRGELRLLSGATAGSADRD